MLKLIGVWNPTRGVWETDRHDLLSEHSEPFSATWPSSGMTRSGRAFERPMPALLTAGTGSSSLPTPLASDARKQSLAYSRGNPTLRGALQTLPTPRAMDARLATTGSPAQRKHVEDGFDNLPEVVGVHLMPTPNAMVSNDGEGVDTWMARRERLLAKGINGNGMGMPLTIAVQLLPTPTTADVTGGHKTRGGSRSSELLLPGVAALLATPTTSDMNGPGAHGEGGADLRTQVAGLPGANTQERSSDGSSSPE